MIGVILICVGGFLYFAEKHFNHHHSSAFQIGQRVPDLKLTRLNGEEIFLSNLSAQVTLINFWATWCTACIIEMPSLRELRKKLNSHGFEVVFVSLDENPPELAPPVLKSLQIDFETYMDPEGKLAELFDIHGIPFSLLIDKNREIFHLETGDRDWNTRSIQEMIFSRLKHP